MLRPTACRVPGHEFVLRRAAHADRTDAVGGKVLVERGRESGRAHVDQRPARLRPVPLVGQAHVGRHAHLAARDVLSQRLRHADEYLPRRHLEHLPEIRVFRVDDPRSARTGVVDSPPAVDPERLRHLVVKRRIGIGNDLLVQDIARERVIRHIHRRKDRACRNHRQPHCYLSHILLPEDIPALPEDDCDARRHDLGADVVEKRGRQPSTSSRPS